MERESIIGKKYNKLLVIQDASDKGYTRYVNCLCDCGNYKIISFSKIKSGHTKSCGCLHKQVISMREEVVGNIYNRLTVLKELVSDNKDRIVQCLCKCGKEKAISLPKLKSGHTKSCGCYSKEIVSKRITIYNKVKPKKVKTQEEIDAQKERYRIKKRDYCRIHKEKIKQYKKANKERILTYAKNLQKEKMKDPTYVLLKRLRSRIYTVLKKGQKSETTRKLLGCDLDFFKEYIEGHFVYGMSWDNMGKWHLDHIKPCKTFDLSKQEEQLKCFNYKNIQPLWATDNLKKGSKYE